VYVFHYHLVTSRVREVEARYIGKLGFDLVARHGRVGEDLHSFEPGLSWGELDELGFKLRLTELECGAVNVVVQPGQWPLPRVDHLGLALDEDEFEAAMGRAERGGLRVQEHGGRRTFVSTNAGYRLELHPPRDWIDELLSDAETLRLAELHLKSDDPEGKAQALAEVLDCERIAADVEIGDALIRFTPGGPQGRPELEAEMFA
jgi:catechol 2,3-dioxygenase-like lactoylglutathione lyase family enzyme